VGTLNEPFGFSFQGIFPGGFHGGVDYIL
jgi:hypothetical protein